jgi:hypothetical protein
VAVVLGQQVVQLAPMTWIATTMLMKVKPPIQPIREDKDLCMLKLEGTFNLQLTSTRELYDLLMLLVPLLVIFWPLYVLTTVYLDSQSLTCLQAAESQMSLGNVTGTPGDERFFSQAIRYLRRAETVPRYTLSVYLAQYLTDYGRYVS